MKILLIWVYDFNNNVDVVDHEMDNLTDYEDAQKSTSNKKETQVRWRQVGCTQRERTYIGS